MKGVVAFSVAFIFLLAPSSGSPASLQDHQEIASFSAPLLEIEKEIIENGPNDPYVLAFTGGIRAPQTKVELPASASEFLYAFIMVNGTLTPQRKTDLEGLGVTIFNSHTFHSSASKIPITNITSIAELPFVVWMGTATPSQKLTPTLQSVLGDENEHTVFVKLFEDDAPYSESLLVQKKIEKRLLSLGPFGKALQNIGLTPVAYDWALHGYQMKGVSEAIARAAEEHFVYAIDLIDLPLTQLHDESGPAIAIDYVKTSYTGVGIWSGIIDSGYEKDHVDLPDATYCIDYNASDCYTDQTGHGTHVAGTFWGRGIADQKFKGVAPGVSNIQIAKVTIGSGGVSEIMQAMDWMALSPAAEIVSMSLGAPNYGPCTGTDSFSQKVDSIIFSNNQNYVIAAGNCGPAGDPAECGGVTPGSSGTILVPACSKNAIAVGNIVDWGINQADSISLSSSRGHLPFE